MQLITMMLAISALKNSLSAHHVLQINMQSHALAADQVG